MFRFTFAILLCAQSHKSILAGLCFVCIWTKSYLDNSGRKQTGPTRNHPRDKLHTYTQQRQKSQLQFYRGILITPSRQFVIQPLSVSLLCRLTTPSTTHLIVAILNFAAQWLWSFFHTIPSKPDVLVNAGISSHLLPAAVVFVTEALGWHAVLEHKLMPFWASSEKIHRNKTQSSLSYHPDCKLTPFCHVLALRSCGTMLRFCSQVTWSTSTVQAKLSPNCSIEIYLFVFQR